MNGDSYGDFNDFYIFLSIALCIIFVYLFVMYILLGTSGANLKNNKKFNMIAAFGHFGQQEFLQFVGGLIFQIK